jgi:hypothetical protein
MIHFHPMTSAAALLARTPLLQRPNSLSTDRMGLALLSIRPCHYSLLGSDLRARSALRHQAHTTAADLPWRSDQLTIRALPLGTDHKILLGELPRFCGTWLHGEPHLTRI